MLGQLDIQGLQERLSQLQRRQRMCDEQGHYAQSLLIEDKLKLTKTQIIRQKLIELRKRQKNELNQLQGVMKIEFQRFKEFQLQKVKAYEEQTKKVEEELLATHKNRLIEYRQQISSKLPLIDRQTGTVIDLRKREGHMVKQKSYKQALQLRQLIKEFKNQDIIRSVSNRKKKTTALMQKEELRLNMQHRVFKMRSQESFKVLIKQIKAEHDKMRLRHKNIRSELKAQHEKEALMLQGKFTSKIMFSTC